MDDVRTLVVAADPLARAGLAALLAGQPGCAVVGRATNGEDLPSAIEAYRPDVVLWDLGWDPGPALEQLAEQGEDLPPVVALAPDVSAAAMAWQAGARALLRRDVGPEQLVAALTAVTQGLTVIEPAFAPALWSQPERSPFSPDTETPPLIEPLTPRELEVLRLLADGLPNKTIARRLGISEHTVKFHVNAILGKLGAAGRTEAVVRATRLGLILL